LFTKQEWQKLAERLSNLSFARADSRAFSRLMLAGAMEVEIDGQGRVVLPEYLRDYAGLTKEVIVAGLYNRLELWDKDQWAAYTKNNEKESGKIAEQMSELGV
jgi:MraZ protein